MTITPEDNNVPHSVLLCMMIFSVRNRMLPDINKTVLSDIISDINIDKTVLMN